MTDENDTPSPKHWSERDGLVLYECTCKRTLRPGEPEQRERNPTCPEHGTASPERDIRGEAIRAALERITDEAPEEIEDDEDALLDWYHERGREVFDILNRARLGLLPAAAQPVTPSEPVLPEWVYAKHKCAWCGEQMLVRLADRKQRCPNDCASGLGACPEKFLPDGAAPDEGHRREFDPNTGAEFARSSTYTLTRLPPAEPSRSSTFNAEQQEHMADLARIPAAQRCWCAWYRLGECPHCPAGRTAEEKLARKQPCCGFTPSHPDEPDGHYVGCKRETSR